MSGYMLEWNRWDGEAKELRTEAGRASSVRMCQKTSGGLCSMPGEGAELHRNLMTLQALDIFHVDQALEREAEQQISGSTKSRQVL